MNAWADGLNFYLSKHPEREAARDHALRAVDGAVVQRRQHRRRHRARLDSAAESVLREGTGARRPPSRPARASADDALRRDEPVAFVEPAVRTGSRSVRRMTAERARDAADQSAHVVLLPRRSADGQRGRAERVRRAHVGPVLHLPGLQRAKPAGCTRRAAWTTSTSTSRRVDEEGRGFYKVRRRQEAAGHREADRRAVQDRRRQHGDRRRSPSTARITGRSCAQLDGKWVSVRTDEEPAQRADAVLLAHQGEELSTEFQEGRWSCTPTRRTTRCTPTPTATSPTSTPTSFRTATRRSTGRRPVDGSNPATEWKGLHSVDESPNVLNPAERLGLQHEQLPVVRRRPEQPEAGRLSRATWTRGERESARPARHQGADEQEGVHARLAHRRGVRQLSAVRSTRCSRRSFAACDAAPPAIR